MSEPYGSASAANHDEVARHLVLLAEMIRGVAASVTGEHARSRWAILTRIEAIKAGMTSVQRRASIEGLDLRCEWDKLAAEFIALTKQLSKN
jgi:hypothetical protein